MPNKRPIKSPETSSKQTKSGKFYYGLGRRKSAIAMVKLYDKAKANKTKESADTKGTPIIINNQPLADYFPFEPWQETVMSPLTEVNLVTKFETVINVTGGGKRGQSEAVRLGMSRALLEFDNSLRPALKAKGYLSRDSRIKERKKPGLKRARRAPQWSKR